MNLDAISRTLLIRFALDDVLFRAYAEEFSGLDRTGWPGESVTPDEGRVLYALTRLLRPARVLEFGVCGGYSSTHFLSALDKNEIGELVSVDVEPVRPPGPPQNLRARWRFIPGNGVSVDLQGPFDLIFEDTSHIYTTTRELVLRSFSFAPKMIVVHDVANPTSGADVRRALDDTLGRGRYAVVVPDDSVLGLAIWSRTK